MENNLIVLPMIEDGEDKSSPLKNRIRKNYKHFRKWAKRTETDCFRIYDRDIKEYPIAIDFYAGHFCIFYYALHREEDAIPINLKQLTEETLFTLFGSEVKSINWRTRNRRTQLEQHEKKDNSQQFFTVLEYGVKFKVNLSDYLDTGLFLDHRETRRIVAHCSKGKKVLNLFAYTCAFSVHAALAGATFTKSVDLSNTYTKWGRKNFDLNGISAKNHPIVRADCMKFLDEERMSSDRYDLIIIDPPTLSRSKKMDQLFDIQKDYALLIHKAIKLLNKEGVIFFSCNSKRFSFELMLESGFHVEEITHKTVPLDFDKHRIHRCWKITNQVL